MTIQSQVIQHDTEGTVDGTAAGVGTPALQSIFLIIIRVQRALQRGRGTTNETIDPMTPAQVHGHLDCR